MYEGGCLELGRSVSSDEARAHLNTLVGLYMAGQQAPLSFFPKTSWAYIDQLTKPKGDETKALKAASTVWNGGHFKFPEKDAYHEMIYGSDEPFNPGYLPPGAEASTPTFSELVDTIWVPFQEERV